MSEENEESEERVAEDVKNLLKQGKKTITVKHIFKDERRQQSQVVDDDAEGDDEDIKKKLQEREAQLAALALKDFNDKKSALLSQIEDEDERARLDEYIGDDPDNYKTVKALKGIGDNSDDGAETPPPKGKVRGLLRKPKEDTQTLGKFQNPELSTIVELYKIRERKAKNTDDIKMKNVAEVKVNELFNQMEDGLKARSQGNKYNFQVAECSNCGTVLFERDAEIWSSEGRCVKCGYTPKKGGH